MSGAAAPQAPQAMHVSLSTIVYLAITKLLPVNPHFSAFKLVHALAYFLIVKLNVEIFNINVMKTLFVSGFVKRNDMIL